MIAVTTALLLQLLTSASPRDAKLLRDARVAQARFEGLRRMNLPRDWGGGYSGRCDAQIGRYCYWFDSTESPPRPEPKQITDARAKLLAFLDTVAARNPTDGWVAGQRTRYLIEGGRPDDAVSAAKACRAESWWCAALGGLSLHVAERYLASDSAFAVALQDMGERQRCEWLDIRVILSDNLAREFARATCADRGRLADKLWTLGQPLWSTAGNDLRTEHFSRLTMAAMQAGTANPYGMFWGNDSREMLLRYGWPEWFTQHESATGAFTTPSTTGHDREPSYYFFPDVPAAAAQPRLSDQSWNLRQPTARTRYAPRHLKAMSALSHQLVRFPRGDSMLVVVAIRIFDTSLAREAFAERLATYRKSELRVGVRQHVGGLLQMTIASDTTVFSIEAYGDSTKRAARARYTIDPLPCSAGQCLSDLLLYDPARGYSGSDATLAMNEALTDLQLPAGSPLGLLWELQHTGKSEDGWMSVTVEPIHVSVVRRLATRLHLTPRPAPVTLSWQTMVRDGTWPESVVLRLPANARGKYRVVLEIRTRSRPTTTASREIELVP